MTVLADMRREGQQINKSSVARRAGVSVVFIRSHEDLCDAIERTANMPAQTGPSAGDKAKDQLIAALRRRNDDLKQENHVKQKIIQQQRHEIAVLYGKLAAKESLERSDVDRLHGLLRRLEEIHHESND